MPLPVLTVFSFLARNTRAIAISGAVLAVVAAAWYVTGLRADLAVSQANEAKLRAGVAEQAKLLQRMQRDLAQQKKIYQDLDAIAKQTQREVASLEERFRRSANGDARDIGALAVARPDSIERIINNGSMQAARCFELATGDSLTKEEKNAKTPNTQCPGLVNPRSAGSSTTR